MRVVGYLRVSTVGQEYGIEAQRAAIAATAEQRWWDVEWIEDAGRSGKDINRPGITRALSILRAGEAEALVVSKLDRLSRSLADFARLLETAGKQGWGVVAIDLGIDTTTPTGELVANIMAAVSRWERQMIGVRTREGLAVAKAKGKRLGSPVLTSPETAARIIEERRGGATLAAIAEGLNRDSVPRAGGGAKWYPSSVSKVARRTVG
ncbi:MULTISPECIES: recombinase family protein [unclassified Rathayibacter]|uniref:recombinase family protein n=1 Tax=unclassified Rathayibacter TaxID=2609250 RepID=UPI0010DF3AD9|nr:MULTISPECIES: recombinase family protein [unclassified Rathayibacter]MCJ1703703.1 recombinase family protein [Rathayibacter sp. VKM Ac-2926]TCL84352.1 DNA invertase Pin-like site-specific DNA recombinase [Rathayibacter sp. PhB192]TCM30070.1 DNA invertase Pin-like site-specific DNA recombinase [Rathayibacter sp. PhB179]